MATINRVVKNVKNLSELRDRIPFLILSTSQMLIELNRSQLYRGVDKNNEKLIPYRSMTYAIDKDRMNSAPGFGFPDLYLTGDFYRAWHISVSKIDITFTSMDSKTPALQSKYGDDIFGLTIESKTKYINDALFETIRKFINDRAKI